MPPENRCSLLAPSTIIHALDNSQYHPETTRYTFKTIHTLDSFTTIDDAHLPNYLSHSHSNRRASTPSGHVQGYFPAEDCWMHDFPAPREIKRAGTLLCIFVISQTLFGKASAEVHDLNRFHSSKVLTSWRTKWYLGVVACLKADFPGLLPRPPRKHIHCIPVLQLKWIGDTPYNFNL